ncbi:MAG: restriction endonuclease subunit S [Marinilabiliaceae bacterium]|nr:restriction endonuclease subunit S [Marinilabiliaceae bacterium]
MEKLSKVFAANERIERVVLYGSRAKGNYKPFSDVDITLEGAELTHTDLNRISLAIDDLLLPYQFDISIFYTLKNEALIDHIRRMGITIYEKKSEWKEYKLEEIAEILDYKRRPLSSMERSKRKGKYPYYGASGIIDTIDDYIFEGEHVLISEDGENLRTRQTPIAFLADGQFWVNNHAHIVKSDWLHNRLICYYFANLDLNPYITGAVQPKLSQESLNRIPLLLPESTEERKRIVSILSSLDDKIDLLHRENATLEKMAETLFRQWFVVEAKEEWEEGKLGDILTVKGGTTPSTKEPSFWDGDIAWTSPRDVTTLNGLYLFETEKRITQKGLEQISSGLLPSGTLLMSSRAPVGVLAFAEIPLAINQGYIAILDDNGYSKEFVYLWLKTNMDVVHSYSNGSTFMEISKSAFKSLDIVIPPKEEVGIFVEKIKPYFEKIRMNEIQISTLIQTRDGLLPRLMSGDVKM